jgi:hypothetical protein
LLDLKSMERRLTQSFNLNQLQVQVNMQRHLGNSLYLFRLGTKHKAKTALLKILIIIGKTVKMHLDQRSCSNGPTTIHYTFH